MTLDLTPIVIKTIQNDDEAMCKFYDIINSEEIKTLEDLKEFYKENYVPSNTSIAVVSSLDFNSVKEIINRFFGGWKFRKRLKTFSSLK